MSDELLLNFLSNNPELLDQEIDTKGKLEVRKILEIAVNEK